MATTTRTLDPNLVYLHGAGLGRSSAPVQRSAQEIGESGANDVSIKIIINPALRADADAWIQAKGGAIVSAGGQVLLVDLPGAALIELDGEPWALRAEGSRELQPSLDDARGAATGLDGALAAMNPARTGAGVVVGVVDTGVDWSHADFQNDDGTTRLGWFGHARDVNGQNAFSGFDAAAIDAALGGGGGVPQGDPNGHGTHVASIAAGNGRASGGDFRGVATGATLMGVRSDDFLDSQIIWGIRQIFERAGDRPAVVNLSLGGHVGPHDGTSAIENVIAQESGPGRIVVVAAGNEGQDGVHWQADLTAGVTTNLRVRVVSPDMQWVDLWIPRGDTVDVRLFDGDGQPVVIDGSAKNTTRGAAIATFQNDRMNRDQNFNMRMVGRPGDTWTIAITPSVVTQGDAHAWSGTTNPRARQSVFPDNTGPAYAVGMPGTEERAITVASSVTAKTLGRPLQAGQLSTFSSHGPTRSGRLKPDIAAPGQHITAALSANSAMANDPNLASVRDPARPYITIQGTSMAAPFVAGLIALMLEAEPELTPEEVQHRLRVTAGRDAQTERVWNAGWGFGKVDAGELLTYSDS